MSVAVVWLSALPGMLALSVVAWAIATARRNVGLVDVFWSLFLLLGAVVYAWVAPAVGTRVWQVLAIVATWALRLAGYLALRNWNAPEDHRYRAIRERNEPGFAWKSIVLVFGLQALLAWIISAPLAVAVAGTEPIGAWDVAGFALAAFGIAFESIADAQLAQFKADPANAQRVMASGLWRFTRHPNYFGECCVWWGVYLIAIGAGGWWTAFSPVVMTVLLLRISGVTLLEKTIGDRRPAYREYAARTNAFFPGPPREA